VACRLADRYYRCPADSLQFELQARSPPKRGSSALADYMTDKRAREIYRDLLCFLRNLGSQEQFWFALPGEVDQ